MDANTAKRLPDFPNLGRLRSATAAFWLVPPGGAGSSRIAFQGTGALVGNSRRDGAPYFLTSNHCLLSSPRSSRCRKTAPLSDYPNFEAFWDYTADPGGDPLLVRQAEDLRRLPRSVGATLVAADARNDFALLRLHSLPQDGRGRTFLGWQAEAVEESEFHRVSHPYGLPQCYSRHLRLSATETGDRFETLGSSCCRCRPSSLFHHSSTLKGQVFPGSSGAPLVTSDLRIVGQLWGTCQREGRSFAIDGDFRHTYHFVREWLDPLGHREVPAVTW